MVWFDRELVGGSWGRHPPLPTLLCTMDTMTPHRERQGEPSSKPAASPAPSERAQPLDRSTELALRALEEAEEAVRNLPPIVLDDHYLAMIARIEAMPWNSPGTDKTWVHELHDSNVAHFAKCRRLP